MAEKTAQTKIEIEANPEDEQEIGNGAPAEPKSADPPEGCGYPELYKGVRNALYALPAMFSTELSISGVLATDLFTFNTSLGATIEAQVVAQLNRMRDVWDEEEKYATYSFVRQAQRFPDVILRSSSPEIKPEILMGIELKGWYVLSKESEPSFRYKVSPNVCAPCDLLAVYPWALGNVISGSPMLYQPFVTGSRFAAAYRNWHWEYKRKSASDKGIKISKVSHPYPSKADMISDIPNYDSGGNFGRLARASIMDAYMKQLFAERLSGIPIYAWLQFLSLFSDDKEDNIQSGLNAIAKAVEKGNSGLSGEVVTGLRDKLVEMAEILKPGG